MTDAGELTLSEQSYYEEAIGETAYNSYTDILYVLPDSICEKLLPVIKNRYITTEENISYENARELEKFFYRGIPRASRKRCYVWNTVQYITEEQYNSK